MAAKIRVPESHRDLFAPATVGLSTLNADGTIQTTAVWMLLGEDGVPWTSLSRNRHKVKNLTARPTATIFAISPSNPFHTIEVRANVTIEDDPDRSYLNQVCAAYGTTPEQLGLPTDDERVTVTFRPVRVLADSQPVAAEPEPASA